MFNLWFVRNSDPPIRRGYARTASVLSFNHDGLEIARAKRSSRSRWLPVWHFVFFIYLVLLIRIVAIADIGAAAYSSRIQDMRDGTIIERAAAQVMGLDPISGRAAVAVRGFFNFISGD